MARRSFCSFQAVTRVFKSRREDRIFQHLTSGGRPHHFACSDEWARCFAEDLTLSQPYALRFLPDSMIDESMLERFAARSASRARISHPTFAAYMT